MSHWNHRVVRRTSTYIDPLSNKEKKETYYRVEECYYEDGKKTPFLMTDGKAVQGSSIKELEWTLKHMLKCLKHPVVNGDKLSKRKSD